MPTNDEIINTLENVSLNTSKNIQQLHTISKYRSPMKHVPIWSTYKITNEYIVEEQDPSKAFFVILVHALELIIIEHVPFEIKQKDGETVFQVDPNNIKSLIENSPEYDLEIPDNPFRPNNTRRIITLPKRLVYGYV